MSKGLASGLLIIIMITYDVLYRMSHSCHKNWGLAKRLRRGAGRRFGWIVLAYRRRTLEDHELIPWITGHRGWSSFYAPKGVAVRQLDTYYMCSPDPISERQVGRYLRNDSDEFGVASWRRECTGGASRCATPAAVTRISDRIRFVALFAAHMPQRAWRSASPSSWSGMRACDPRRSTPS